LCSRPAFSRPYPSGHPNKALPAPTGDLNLTLALSLFVVVAVHVTAIRTLAWRGYLGHYLKPSPGLLPLRLREELVKPATLALRLFGNIFAGTVTVVLIFELIPPTIAPIPLLAWKLFSVFVAGMQAFIFALLTVLYFDAALAPDDIEPLPDQPSPAAITTGGITE
jgi:F-type H+-transporting ATPase subunit a